ncbi:MAG: hypothetical protein JHC20_03340 [Pyrobaculum sp.]|nr:hypothetical protein [Pyrobaculum sp.]
MALTPEEKRRFLKALEEDEEFKMAVAGTIGLGEILEELKRLREDFEKWIKRKEGKPQIRGLSASRRPWGLSQRLSSAGTSGRS